MNWYIGQKIVAVRDHVEHAFKKGDEFIINGIDNAFCKCNNVLLDVGLVGRHKKQKCLACGCNSRKSDDIYWFGDRSFAPIETTEDKIELSEITAEQLIEELEVKELQTA